LAQVDHGARLGTLARSLRRSQGLTLDVIAQRSGLSKGFLSRLESGSANPTLASLSAVAAALGADLGELFGGDPLRTVVAALPTAHNGDSVGSVGAGHVVRPPSTRPDGESRTYRLTPTTNRLFEVLLSDGGPDDASTEVHDGREFVRVVAGRARIDIGGEHEVLEEGDSITYDSSQPHSVRADVERTRLLIVICPPLAG
jgi:mannose-6-phosphate isomerase-like protein (cupin superfamily)/DNA-binding XRE family transcriptional regulator